MVNFGNRELPIYSQDSYELKGMFSCEQCLGCLIPIQAGESLKHVNYPTIIQFTLFVMISFPAVPVIPCVDRYSYIKI